MQTKKLISFSFFSENSISILMMSKKVFQKQKRKKRIQIRSTKKRKTMKYFLHVKKYVIFVRDFCFCTSQKNIPDWNDQRLSLSRIFFCFLILFTSEYSDTTRCFIHLFARKKIFCIFPFIVSQPKNKRILVIILLIGECQISFN